MHFSLISRSFIEGLKNNGGASQPILKGGAEVNLYHTASLLIDKGHDVTVIQQAVNHDVDNFDGINIDYINVPNLYSSRLESLFFNLAWRKTLDKDTLVHLQSPVASIPFFTGINSVNQPGINWNAPSKLPLQKYFLKRLLSAGSIVRASDNSFLSFVQAEWPELSNQVYPIPNGVKTDVFAPKKNSRDDISVNISERRTILFPRNLNGTHGTFLFINTMEHLKRKKDNFVGVLLGDDDTRTGSKAKRLVCKYDLTNNISFPGHIPNGDMVNYYNAADIVVVPTPYSEGSSIACLEAMSCATPVVATDIGGLKEIIYRDYTDGGVTVKPLPEKLSQSIYHFLEKDELITKVGRNGRERVCKYYTHESWEKSMSSFFDLVIRKSECNGGGV
jgi:glycosyltransferase involved in cell wall biosynthesis